MTQVSSANSPSIGKPGVNVDYDNNRVKVLPENILHSKRDIISCLHDNLSSNTDARAVLTTNDARFTARVLTPRNQIDKISSFNVTSNLLVSEEARISIGAYDLIYVGGNTPGRFDKKLLALERETTLELVNSVQRPVSSVNATFHRLRELTDKDIRELTEMFELCYTSYLVQLNDFLLRNAARNSIFMVARNSEGRIITCAIGESLRLGPITLFEISEGASHPIYRVKGAATECIKQVLAEGKRTLAPQVFAFIEARIWKNITGISKTLGYTEYAGILHQHCVISTPSIFNSIRQTKYGSLAVCYCPT